LRRGEEHKHGQVFGNVEKAVFDVRLDIDQVALSHGYLLRASTKRRPAADHIIDLVLRVWMLRIGLACFQMVNTHAEGCDSKKLQPGPTLLFHSLCEVSQLKCVHWASPPFAWLYSRPPASEKRMSFINRGSS